MVYFFTTAFRYRGKDYYVSPPALLSNCPPEGAGVGVITTLTMHGVDAQTIQLQCNRHGLRRPSIRSGCDSYEQLTFGPLFL